VSDGRPEPGSNRYALIEHSGPGPFVTRRVYLRGDGSRLVWHSRHHRKGILAPELAALRADEVVLARSLWMPEKLNWWIGVTFALGAFLFGLGSILWLVPGLAAALGVGAQAVNAVFFCGSIPFTTAAYLQLYQAANAGEFSADDGGSRRSPRRIFFGWEPRNIGWLSCALQFVGTLLFNINTFFPLIPGMNWLQQDIAVWTPDFAGSILFLASGYLAFAEVCHAFWRWDPKNISWWVMFTNLIGCLAFMASAFFAFVPPHPFPFDAGAVAVAFTLIGAIGFFAGSVLMLPEAYFEQMPDSL
jgi:hypothetical protein